MPEVSFLILTYNQSHIVTDTIKSVMSQTFKDFEVIIYDDCSNDGTYEILLDITKSDPRFHVYRQPINVGIASNFNSALMRCCGDYIALLGGDDLCYPHRIEKQLLLAKSTGESFIASDGDVIDEEGNKIDLFSRLKRNKLSKDRKISVLHFISAKCTMLPSSFFIERRLFDNVKIDSRFSVFFDFILDVELVERAGGIRYISTPTVQYRVHAGNVGKMKKDLLFEEGVMAMSLLIKRYPKYSKQLISREKRIFLYNMLVDIDLLSKELFIYRLLTFYRRYGFGSLFYILLLPILRFFSLNLNKIRALLKSIGV